MRDFQTYRRPHRLSGDFTHASIGPRQEGQGRCGQAMTWRFGGDRKAEFLKVAALGERGLEDRGIGSHCPHYGVSYTTGGGVSGAWTSGERLCFVKV